jgi:hypothetical protein
MLFRPPYDLTMKKALLERRIFALSNRTNMLHTISWGEFFTVMTLVYGLYYSWWLIRYYPTLRWSRKGAADRDRMVMPAPVKAAVEEVIGKPDQAVAVTGQATQTTDLPLPMPAVIRKPVFLPMVMGDLMNQVRQLLEKVPELPESEQGLPASELVPPLRELLKREPYPQLRGTVFETKIVELIVRELQRHGPIAVDAMTVKGWWE